MATENIEFEYVRDREKLHWHLYGLQPLSTEKFLTVVERIIDGRYEVINTRQPMREAASA